MNIMEKSPRDTDPWSDARIVIGSGTLSILMPAYNLAPVIAENVRSVAELFRGKIPFEIVVVDDGSSDGTAGKLTALQGEVPELKPVVLKHNVGKGAALRHGFEHARGTFIIFLDADLDLPPDQIPRFFTTMFTSGADVVIGSKQHPESVLQYPVFRKVMSGIYFRIIKLLFGLPIHDTQTGLKLFRREALEWAFSRILVKAYAFDLELLVLIHQRGFQIAEAPVTIDFKNTSGFVHSKMVRGIINDTLAIFYRLHILKYYHSIPDTRVPDPPPLVTIIIACPAPSEYLDESLAGLKDQTYTNFEVLVLPDHPSGRAWEAGITEIPTGAIRPAEKRNIGIEHAKGELVVFLDDDAYPAPDWLERGLAYFTIPAIAAVGGPGITPPTDPWLARMSGEVYANALVSGAYRFRYTPGRIRETDDFPSCNLFVRTHVLRQLKGFRTDFWPGEDTYLCMDIVHVLKQKIIYEPRAVVYHHRRKLFLPHLRQISRYGLHRGYFARHFPSTSRRIGYLMPSIFVIGITAGAVAVAVLPILRLPYGIALGVYAVTTMAGAFRWRPADWVTVWLGIVLTHLTYGTRFMIGILARRLPGQVRKFDHPSEQAAHT